MTETVSKAYLQRFHERIAEKARDVAAAPVVIVAFGDSVTQGFTRARTIEHAAVYHQQLKQLLEHAYPGTTFSVVNAGVARHTATDSLKRLERDVIRYQPDLVLVAFGLNDAVASGEDREFDTFRTTLNTMVDAILGETESDIVLLTPNFMATGDNPSIDPTERHHLEALSTLQTQGVLANCAEVVREVAEARHLPVVDVYAAWLELARKGVDTNGLLANGLNHPNAEAHRLSARLIMQLVEEAT